RAAVFCTTGLVISPPMAMTCHLASTCGDDSGFRRHLWRSFSSCIADAAQISLAAVFGTRGTVISPPMAMTCHLASTYGDDSGFRRHPRRRFPNVVGKKNHLPTIRRLRRTTAPTPSLRTNLCERHLRRCTEDAAKDAVEDAAKVAAEDAAKVAAEDAAKDAVEDAVEDAAKDA